MPLTLPNTWKVCQDKKFLQIYDEVYDEAKSLGLLNKHHKKQPLYIHKSVRTWGLCRWFKMGDNSYDCAVCLNEKIILAKSYDVARQVLVHEIAHIAAPAEHHSKIWHRAGDLIGRKWNITVNRTDSYEGIELRSDNNAKYIIECPKCHLQWKYSRAGKVVQHYDRCKCPKCNINVIRVK